MTIFPVLALTTKTPVMYRLFDSSRRLLYIGSTTDIADRLLGHANVQSWWHEVAYVGLENFPTIAEAARAEREAIGIECPEHNVQHNAFRGMLPPLCVAPWMEAA